MGDDRDFCKGVLQESGFSSIDICDMIQGNESHVEDFQFKFLTPPSGNLHFDANPIRIGCLVTEL